MPLDNRTQNILNNLVNTYIQQGSPVGSTTLAKLPDISVSSATIRNVMHDLEKLGLITAPHTSAGRVPTQQGYRLFVDSIVKASPLTKQVIEKLTSQFEQDTNPDTLLAQASETLSGLTQFAGVVLLPNQSVTRFHQLEFMPLSDNRVLTILVTEDGRVQNRVLTIAQDLSESELTQAANFFNHRYKGSTLDEVRRKLVEDMREDNDEMHRINQTAILAASQVIADEDTNQTDSVVLSGEQKLLDVPDLCQIQTLQKLFDAFKTKSDLVGLLGSCMKATGISVFIGEESGYSALGECSVIASPYKVDGEVIGTLGVIGPTRMMYGDIISVVDITAKLLGQALQK